MGSPKVVDLERELAYLWFAAVWGLRRYVGCGDLWVWRYRGLQRYGVAAVWGLCRYLRGEGLVTVAERTVEVDGGGFLLKDCEHDVGGG
uniref:Uncharacterized protein n=1 Tax=Fagus sylvatica TaxID=28930 RepID=A0A2N9E1C3_FAGSY